MPVITPIGVVVGLALGSRIAAYKGWGTFFFACITFIGALQISFSQVAKALRRGRTIGMVLVCAHVLLPLIVKALASLAFPSSPSYVTGFILLSSIPIAVHSFLWTTIHAGTEPWFGVDPARHPALTALDPLTVRLLADSSVQLDFKAYHLSLVYDSHPFSSGHAGQASASEACTNARHTSVRSRRCA
jgi:tagaturonate reductase